MAGLGHPVVELSSLSVNRVLRSLDRRGAEQLADGPYYSFVSS